MKSVKVPNRCRQPDIQRLIDDYGDSLLRMCFLYLNDRYLAEDCVQETFIKVYKGWSGFKGNSSEKTWIMRIAINTCKDRLRSVNLRVTNLECVLREIPCEEGPEYDDTVILEIMRLEPRYKDVILLFYYHGLKIREIAKLVHIPESTVAVRLKRAREKLKSRLKGWYYDE